MKTPKLWTYYFGTKYVYMPRKKVGKRLLINIMLNVSFKIN